MPITIDEAIKLGTEYLQQAKTTPYPANERLVDIVLPILLLLKDVFAVPITKSITSPIKSIKSHIPIFQLFYHSYFAKPAKEPPFLIQQLSNGKISSLTFYTNKVIDEKMTKILNQKIQYIYSKTNEIAQMMNLGEVKFYFNPSPHGSIVHTTNGLNYQILEFSIDILDIEDSEALDFLIAHELAHLKHKDIIKEVISRIFITLVKVLIILRFRFRYSLPIVVGISVLTYIFSNAVSRQMERNADWEGMIQCNSSLGMILFCLYGLKKNYKFKTSSSEDELALLISPVGNSRSDITHDPWTERLALALSFKPKK